MKNNQKGFTLVELLVVVSIIGLLSTLAVVALGSARVKARDAKRVSDVKQIQTALELYFSDQNGYPVEATAVTLGSATDDALSNDGFEAIADTSGDTVYMSRVPGNPTPACAQDAGTTADETVYQYTSADGSTYTLTFCLEGATTGLAAGLRTADPGGVR